MTESLIQRQVPKYTPQQVEHFLGSDITLDECIAILTELANGEYRIDQLRSDIDQTLKNYPMTEEEN